MAPTHVLPLRDIPDDALALAGGKAVNLGRLIRGGLPVPDGFVILTSAHARGRDSGRVPDDIRAEILAAYADLGAGPVAVRSSATAEDLAEASFAGQQDTFLNVIGADALIDAVERCWASLFTERAIAYRAHLGIADADVALAVVVQTMVDVRAAGVMFTADPLTGSRAHTSIDANPGLGEAVVSGAVNPDRFVVDTATGHILTRNLGDKRLEVLARADGGVEHRVRPADTTATLTDPEIAELTALGARVTALYGAPQDTEWALATDGSWWLTQARPITTLFPLITANRPGRRVFFCVSLAQGLTRPITPIGRGSVRLISTSIARVVGMPVSDPRAGAPAYAEAAGRVFLDITAPLHHPGPRRLIGYLLGYMEARSAQALALVAEDPRLPVDRAPWAFVPTIARVFAATGLPVHAVRALVDPDRAAAEIAQITADARLPLTGADASARERLAAVEEELGRRTFLVMPGVAGRAVPGFAMLALARRVLAEELRPGELETVMRALPHNPTTEMDLELWDLAQGLDPAVRAWLTARTPAQATADHLAGQAPAAFSTALNQFLDTWGDRAVAEIDLGMPRWRDEPEHVVGVLRNYVADERAESGRARFDQAVAEAEAKVTELVGRVRGPRRAVAGFALDRVRRLAGLREAPKFALITRFARIREELLAVGDELVSAGRIAAREDVMMLGYADLAAGLDGADLHETVAAHRAAYQAELGRRHIPRLVLEDGTELETLVRQPQTPGTLTGSPASSGQVTGRARVVLDPTGAQLEPGEILVCPSTDPGWTPLFLTAGGLVMEMGGSNSHGAVVAREYGIPAVVGVPDAVQRIRTGDEITVDGSAGTIALSPATQRP